MTREEVRDMTRDEVRDRFPAGTEVIATIYELRHHNIWEPQRAVVHSVISEDEILRGYRFGVIVSYKDELYWVSTEDVEKVEEC